MCGRKCPNTHEPPFTPTSLSPRPPPHGGSGGVTWNSAHLGHGLPLFAHVCHVGLARPVRPEAGQGPTQAYSLRRNWIRGGGKQGLQSAGALDSGASKGLQIEAEIELHVLLGPIGRFGAITLPTNPGHDNLGCSAPKASAAASSSDNSMRRLARPARHQAWIDRYEGGTRPGSWRPMPLHRKAAKHWLEMTDNQIRIHIDSKPEGWALFVPNENDCWKRWQDWPWIGVARDLSSDGLAASMALLYKYRANVSFYDDFSHGCKCDLKVCLRASGIFGMWLLMFCSWNLSYGIDSDESRRLQLHQCMQATFRNETAETCVLYKAYVVQLLDEYRRAGHELAGHKKPEDSGFGNHRGYPG